MMATMLENQAGRLSAAKRSWLQPAEEAGQGPRVRLPAASRDTPPKPTPG